MERLDNVLDYDNMKIYQDSDFFSFSLDSIFLANYATIRLRDSNIVDFCTGNAIIPLVVSRRTNKTIIGVEIQKKLYMLAKKTVDYNKLNNRIFIVNDDIKEYSADNMDRFDLVLCNPPYFKFNDKTKVNLSFEKKIARHEIMITLNDVCRCAFKVLKEKGNFCVVYRTDRFMDVLDEFRKNNIEPKRIKFIYKTVDCCSHIVLIEGQKCGKVGLIIDKPLILYNLDGSMTDEYRLLQREIMI